MRVRATRLGYYGHERRKEGAEFTLEPIKRVRKDAKSGRMREITITAEQQFTERWMERVTPLTTEAPKAEAKQPEAVPTETGI